MKLIETPRTNYEHNRFVTRTVNGFAIEGNTFDCKDTLKGLGMKWNPTWKRWEYTYKSTEEAKRFLKELVTKVDGLTTSYAPLVKLVNSLLEEK